MGGIADVCCPGRQASVQGRQGRNGDWHAGWDVDDGSIDRGRRQRGRRQGVVGKTLGAACRDRNQGKLGDAAVGRRGDQKRWDQRSRRGRITNCSNAC